MAARPSRLSTHQLVDPMVEEENSVSGALRLACVCNFVVPPRLARACRIYYGISNCTGPVPFQMECYCSLLDFKNIVFLLQYICTTARTHVHRFDHFWFTTAGV